MKDRKETIMALLNILTKFLVVKIVRLLLYAICFLRKSVFVFRIINSFL
ncbi:hypothetical protein HNQ74_000792 [Bartonella doshiae]|uniref:Uncharacterized protein n=2 Tax=Bartonella doshiae TaxID=33044 RepID=A0A380ZD96_BARDO|nr:hypothetical protein MCS_00347 [Bartonella doshiae NCTC 12862 = ATCC 700133]MBB6159366.1 hypothetical protein [Bartonella doshiae]SUV44651.1 Uncharacterised protein [Bartonella doshiae]